MSYSDEAIALQLQLGEDSRWEFKQIEFAGSRPRGPSREDLADEIAAFANANGGVLLCSATDAGEVQGMSREQIFASTGQVGQPFDIDAQGLAGTMVESTDG